MLRIDNNLRIKMKIVLHRMDARIRAGRTGEFKLPAKKYLQGLFHFFLDGAGIVLDLESAIVGPFIGYFQKISGHENWVCDKNSKRPPVMGAGGKDRG